jgi:hypothetical protein
MGFLAYAKINPFAAAAAQGGGFSQSSPRSPKNPFSTTSPKHNPFMSFVDKKEEYWNIMSTNPSLANTTSLFGFNSETAQNTITNAVKCDAAATPALQDNKKETDSSTTITKKAQFGSEISSESAISAKPTETDRCSSGGNSPVSGNESDSASPEKPESTEADVALAESYIVANGEEGEECVFQVRAKLFRLGNRVIAATKSDSLTDVKFSTDSDVLKASEQDASKKVETNSTAEEKDKSSEGKVESTKEKADAEAVESNEPNPTDSTDEKPVDASATMTEWIEVGTGPLRILRPSQCADGTATSTKAVYPRIVMRREFQPGGQGTKLILNELVQGHTAVSKIGEKAVRLTVVSMLENKAQPISYLLKTKYTAVSV